MSDVIPISFAGKMFPGEELWFAVGWADELAGAPPAIPASSIQDAEWFVQGDSDMVQFDKRQTDYFTAFKVKYGSVGKHTLLVRATSDQGEIHNRLVEVEVAELPPIVFSGKKAPGEEKWFVVTWELLLAGEPPIIPASSVQGAAWEVPVGSGLVKLTELPMDSSTAIKLAGGTVGKHILLVRMTTDQGEVRVRSVEIEVEIH